MNNHVIARDVCRKVASNLPTNMGMTSPPHTRLLTMAYNYEYSSFINRSNPCFAS
jgi:hypothetical protein